MRAVSQTTLVVAVALVMALAAPAGAANKPLFGAWTPGDPYSGTTPGTDGLEGAIDRRVDIVPWYQS